MTKCIAKLRQCTNKLDCRPRFDCSICMKNKLQKFSAQLPCKHNFCRSCVRIWAKQNNSCPLCRSIFSYYLYKNKRINVKAPRSTAKVNFSLLVEATTEFLQNKDFQETIRDDVLNREAGADIMIRCIYRSLLILNEEQNRPNFEDDDLDQALVAAEAIVECLNNL